MTNLYYILKDKKPVAVDDIDEWGKFFEDIKNRQVAFTVVDTGEEVSTVFLGLDHNFTRKAPPILFGTMIFGGPYDQYQWRYATWDEAEAHHKKVVEKLLAGKEPD